VFIESTKIAKLPRQKLEISIQYRLRQQSNWSENTGEERRRQVLNASLNAAGRPVVERRVIAMWVHLKTKEPFAFAGLWDVWRKLDGKKVESFTIITTEPNELVRPVHNRMPVILSTGRRGAMARCSTHTFRQSQISVEALSRRADGRPRRFANRQLSEVRRPEVHPTCFR
jgi:putative SOS response-associated peptidase YedK